MVGSNIISSLQSGQLSEGPRCDGDLLQVTHCLEGQKPSSPDFLSGFILYSLLLPPWCNTRPKILLSDLQTSLERKYVLLQALK